MFINRQQFCAAMAGRGNNNNIEETQEITRVRLPRGREVLGVVQQRFGGSRMKVLCLDGKTRTCRIPGRLKRTLWVRESNIVVVEPWELSGDDKGDIVFKYTKNQADFLRKNGHLKKLEEVDEF